MPIRGLKNKADESLFGLIGELPGLVKDLLVAEVNRGKDWLGRTAKDYGIGAVFFVLALIVLFWTFPVFVTAAIAGLAVAWPVWLSALTIGGGLLLLVIILALIGLQRMRRANKRENPAQAVKNDIALVREVGNE